MLWAPDPARPSTLGSFVDRLPAAVTIGWSGYSDLWRWSVSDLDGFWGAVWDFFDIPSDERRGPVLGNRQMPGAAWFPSNRVNYAEVMLRCPGRSDNDVVVVGRSQTRPDRDLTVNELRALVGSIQRGLRDLGVERGDRVVAYAPNIPEILALMLACAGLGVVFSSCSPELGSRGVIDRWGQVEPVVMVAVDGYRYGVRAIDRRAEVAEIVDNLPSLRHVVTLPYIDNAEDARQADGTSHPRSEASPHPEATTWCDLVAQSADLVIERVPFNHPLWILFSSGTTGLPKPIVHGHGGITLEHLKALGLQIELGPASRFYWFTTTSWMMWNFLVSGLGVGSTVVLFDGDPGHPDLGATWRLAAGLGVTHFGTSPLFLQQCMSEQLQLAEVADLSTLTWLGSTGAPLPAVAYDWVYDQLSSSVHLSSLSGGTDICSAFVGSAWSLPIIRGTIAGRCLGASVKSYNDTGQEVVGELGELIIDQPMPSMPVSFWGDTDGERYRTAYFDDYKGVWRHGDWITIADDGTCVLSGRSDATLNRGGVRLGTAEFYAVVESFDFVADSLVVHLDGATNADRLLLFVVGAEGALDDNRRQLLSNALRRQLSPRHAPDRIIDIAEVPRTLSGKKVEVSVKRILQGTAVDDVVAPDSLTNPDSLKAFTSLAAAPPSSPER